MSSIFKITKAWKCQECAKSFRSKKKFDQHTEMTSHGKFKDVKSKEWYYKYKDDRGKFRTKKGYTDKSETQKKANQMTQVAYEIKIGTRKRETEGDRASSQCLKEHKEAYIQWGMAHGGKNNKGWDKVHLRKMKSHLKWWFEKADWKIYLDITLQVAEKILQTKGKQLIEKKVGDEITYSKIAGKTVEHYKNDLNSFVNWLRTQYRIKDDHPLEGLTCWDTSVKDPRRDLTLDEVSRLIKASSFSRGTVYLTAAITGLRSEELCDLTDINYSYADSCFKIGSDHNKERHDAVVILIPKLLNERLKKYVEQRGSYDRLFKFDFAHAVRWFDADCVKAGIPKRAFGGKVVFHSLRDTSVNLAIDAGADPKTGMVLSRHSTADIYLKKYAKRKNDKMLDVLNLMDESIASGIEKLSSVGIKERKKQA